MNPELIRDAMRHQPAMERGVLTVSRNPWAPLEDAEPQRIPRGMTIADAFAEYGVDINAATPWIISVDGEWVSRKEWAVREIDPQSYVLIVALPQNGGSKASRVIAGVVLIIIGIIVSAISGGAFSGVGGAIAAFGLSMIAGTVLYKAPKPYTPDTASQLADPSPTYNLQAQGNYARIGQPVPVHYGRVPKFYPDFAAQPYTEYSGNDQYLYQLFVIGWGSFAIEHLFIGDEELTGTLGSGGYYTSSGTWEDVTWEIVPPGGSVTLFPTRVIASDTVSGQEIVVGGVGPFQLSDAEINSAAIDVVASQGMYYANDEGGLDARTASWNVYATKLKQSGAAWVADGNEFLLGSESITAATNTPIRNTYRYPVELGRYRFRLVRTNAKDTDTRANNEIDWYGLRGYVPGTQQYGNITLLAMRMRATDQLTSATSRSINLTATRKLYTWDSINGWSAEPVATRSIAWAWADALTSTEYGCGATDDRVPLAQLATLDAAWAGEGFYCDYRFDRQVTCAEALTLIARTGNAQWYTQGAQYKIWRAQKAGVPVQLYNMRNIRRGSFELDWSLPNSTAPDCYDVWYFDSESAQTAQVRCALADGTQLRPTRIDLDGVTSRTQAWAIGMQMLRSARWHRKNGTLQTEAEGYMAAPGKTIAVTHDVMLTAASAELVAYTGTGKASGDVLTLNGPVEWTTGVAHYIELSTRTGGYSGPWHVTPGANPDQVVLAEPIADGAYVPYTGGKAERTRCNFGPSENVSVKALIVPPIEYAEKDTVTLHWVVEDDRAYADDGSTIPDSTSNYDLATLLRPVVEGLVVVWSGTPSVPTLDASWQPATGATRYLIEISTDGTSWTRIADATTASARISCQLVPTWLRIAAVGTLRGDWATWNGNPATMQSIPADVTGLALTNAVSGSTTVFADMSAILAWNAAARADGYVVDVYRGGSKVATHLRSDTRMEYTPEINRADNGTLSRSVTIRVRALNGAGYSASVAEITINNPQMAATVVAGQAVGRSSILLTVSKPSDSDYAGTRFVVSQSSTANPATLAVAADVANYAATVPVSNAGTWYFWAANYDQFGTDNLNWSPRGQCVVTEDAQGVQTVADASTITAAAGSAPPNGSAYWAVYDLVTKKMWAWDSDSGKYTKSVSASEIKGQISQAQISADVVWSAKQLLVLAGNAVEDPDFTITSKWTLGNNSWFRQPLVEGMTGESAIGVKNCVAFATTGAVQPSTTVDEYVEAVSWQRATWSSGDSLRMRCYINNSSNRVAGMVVYFASASDGTGQAGIWISQATGSVGWISQTITVPANTSYFKIGFWVAKGSVLVGWGRCSMPQLTLAADASLVVDGSVTANKIASAAVTTDKLQASAVTADKIAVTMLSAISAALGNIIAATMEFIGAGWNYIRTNGKWLNDGKNGWILAANGSTGDYFQEFRAFISNHAEVYERRSFIGGVPNYYTTIWDQNGEERFTLDPGLGRFLLKGSIYADNGYFSGELRSASGTFGTVTAGYLQNADNSASVNLGASGSAAFIRAGGRALVSANGSTSFNNVIYSQQVTFDPVVPYTGTTRVDDEGNTVFDKSTNGAWIDIDTGLVYSVAAAALVNFQATVTNAYSAGGTYTDLSMPDYRVAFEATPVQVVYSHAWGSTEVRIKVRLFIYLVRADTYVRIAENSESNWTAYGNNSGNAPVTVSGVQLTVLALN